jgi:hypothetical protein
MSSGVMHDLNDLVVDKAGWTLTEARAINDNEQIVGTGTNSAGQSHGFLLTPLPTWKADGDGSWSQAPNWLIAVPNSTSAEACFTGAITAPRSVTVDVPITVSRVVFDNLNSYTLSGSEPLTISGLGIDVVRGCHAISAPMVLDGNTLISIAAGATLDLSSNSLTGTSTSITKDGFGFATAKNVIATSLAVSGGELRISTKARPDDPSGTSKVTSLSISPGAVLDLANNSAVIDYTGPSALDTIAALVTSGYAGGGWNGTGIVSSQAASNNAFPGAHPTALGFGESSSIFSSFPALFVGQDADSSSVLIRYTLAGDANLDGTVDTVDFSTLAANFGGPGKSWVNGDFNYDGSADTTDFNLLAANFSQTLAAVQPAAVQPIPEPAGLLYSAIGFAALARRATGSPEKRTTWKSRKKFGSL